MVDAACTPREAHHDFVNGKPSVFMTRVITTRVPVGRGLLVTAERRPGAAIAGTGAALFSALLGVARLYGPHDTLTHCGSVLPGVFV
jgi:hypothetical protein